MSHFYCQNCDDILVGDSKDPRFESLCKDCADQRVSAQILQAISEAAKRRQDRKYKEATE